MPEGHTWALIERDGEVTILAVDAFAERVAAAVLTSRVAAQETCL